MKNALFESAIIREAKTIIPEKHELESGLHYAFESVDNECETCRMPKMRRKMIQQKLLAILSQGISLGTIIGDDDDLRQEWLNKFRGY